MNQVVINNKRPDSKKVLTKMPGSNSYDLAGKTTLRLE
jgi:hypothetical protein